MLDSTFNDLTTSHSKRSVTDNEIVKMPNFGRLKRIFSDYFKIGQALKQLETINTPDVNKRIFRIKKLLENFASVMSEIRTDTGLAAPKKYTIQGPGRLLANRRNLRVVASPQYRINNAAMLARSLMRRSGIKSSNEQDPDKVNSDASRGLNSQSFYIILDLDKVKELNHISFGYGDIEIAKQAAAMDRAHKRTTKELIDKHRSEILYSYPPCDIEIIFSTQLYRAGGDEFVITNKLPTDLNGKNTAKEFIALLIANLELEFRKLGTRYSKATPKSPLVDKPYTIKPPEVIWAPQESTLERLIFDHYCYCNGQVPSPKTIDSISQQITSTDNTELTEDSIKEFFAQKKAIIERLQGSRPADLSELKDSITGFTAQHPHFQAFFDNITRLREEVLDLKDHLDSTKAKQEYINAADKILQPTDLDIGITAWDLLNQFHIDSLLGQRVELYEIVKKMEQDGKIQQIVAIEIKTKPLNDIRFSVGSETIKQSLNYCLQVMFGVVEIPKELQQFLLISRDGARNFLVLTKSFEGLEATDPRRILVEEALQKLSNINSFELEAGGQSVELPLGIGIYNYGQNSTTQSDKTGQNNRKNGIDIAKAQAEDSWALGAILILSKIIKSNLFTAFVFSLPEIIKNQNSNASNLEANLEVQAWWNLMTNGRARAFVVQILNYLDGSQNRLKFIQDFIAIQQQEEFNDTLDYQILGTIIPIIIKWNLILPLKLLNLKSKFSI